MVDWGYSVSDIHAFYSLWWNTWSRHSHISKSTADWYARADERNALSLWRKYVAQERARNVRPNTVRDMRKRAAKHTAKVSGTMAVQQVPTSRKHGRRSANKMGSSRAVQQVREHQ